MAKEERWQIASDAELVKRGRILTILGVIILCLGSLVTVGLMSVTGQSGPQRTSSGPIRLAAPKVAGGPSTSGSVGGATTGGTASGGEASGTASGTGAGSTGGAESPATNPDGTPIMGASNLDPNARPAPGTNVLGLPVSGTSAPLPPPPDSGQKYDF